jgi:hypothetical protein
MKMNGDLVEYSREIMVMNVFWKYCMTKNYYFTKWKSLKAVQKENQLMKQSINYDVTYYDTEI